MNKTQTQQSNKQQIKGAIQLSVAILLIFIGFATDGITEYGHHACLIISGILLGIWIKK